MENIDPKHPKIPEKSQNSDLTEELDLKKLVSDPTKLKTADTHIKPNISLIRNYAKKHDGIITPKMLKWLLKTYSGSSKYDNEMYKIYDEKGIDGILENPNYIITYVYLTQTRLPIAEPAIAKAGLKYIMRYISAKEDNISSYFIVPLFDPIIAQAPLPTIIKYVGLTGKPFPEVESRIAKSPAYSYEYTRMIRRRFKLGEPAIAKNAMYSYYYAKYVLKGPFPLGEPAIARSAWACQYAVEILKKRFPLGEPMIAKDSVDSIQYARYALRGRPFPLGEPKIYKDSFYKKIYQTEILKGRPWTGLKNKKVKEAIDLKKLVNDPKKLQTYDTHISPREAYERTLEGEKDEYLIYAIAKDAEYSYNYARYVLKGPFPLGEPVIAKEAWSAYHYAKDILKGPFPLGEPAIARDINYSFDYARRVIKGPFPLAEPALYNSMFSYSYEKNVLRGRPWTGLDQKVDEAIDLKKLVSDPKKLKTFDTHVRPTVKLTRIMASKIKRDIINNDGIATPEQLQELWDIYNDYGLPNINVFDHEELDKIVRLLKTKGIEYIASKASYALTYSTFLGSRFPLGEPAIIRGKHPHIDYIWAYIRDALHYERFILAEPKIAKSKDHVYEYAREIIKGPWPLGEPTIATMPFTSFAYAKYVLKGPFPLGESAIATDPGYSYRYARNILKKPFPPGEPAIAKDATWSFYYAKDVLKGPFPMGEPTIYNNSNYKKKYENQILKGRPWTGLKKKKVREAIDLKNLVSDPKKLKTYKTHISPEEAYERLIKGETDDLLVHTVAKSPEYSYYYALNVLNGPFPMGEPAIRTDSNWSFDYSFDILKGRPWTGLDQKVDEAIDLKNLVSDPKKLKTVDTHISPEEALSRLQKGQKDAYLFNAVSKNPDTAYYYAKHYIGDRFPLGEPAIAKDSEYALLYATNVVKEPWPEGEPAIAKNPSTAYDYSRFIDKRFEIAEPELAKIPSYAFAYAKYVLKGRFEQGEPAIAKNTDLAYEYARDVLQKPFPLGEPAIAKKASLSYNYAEHILKGPFPLGEPTIAVRPIVAMIYAKNVLKGPFPLGEPGIYDSYLKDDYEKNVLKGKPWTGLANVTESLDLKKLVKNPEKLKKYKTHISPREAYERLEKGEKDEYLIHAVAKDARYSYEYARYILKGPFPLGEPIIATHPGWALMYAKYVLGERFPLAEPVIATRMPTSLEYASDVLQDRFPLAEPLIATVPDYAYWYAIDVLKGRFELGEPAIFSHPDYKQMYLKFLNTGEITEAIDLKKLVSDPKKLTTFDTHISSQEAFDRLVAGEKDEYLYKVLSKNPKLCLDYIISHNKKQPLPILEPGIAKSPEESVWYARAILKGPFPLGEPAIAEKPFTAMSYAKDVLEGPFPLGEPAIAKNTWASASYAFHALKDRFELGEPAIAKHGTWALHYAIEILKGPFPRAEKKIAQKASDALLYAKKVLEGPFSDGEKAISKYAKYSYLYAKDILKAPFPEGEYAIYSSPTYRKYYEKRVLKGRPWTNKTRW